MVCLPAGCAVSTLTCAHDVCVESLSQVDHGRHRSQQRRDEEGKHGHARLTLRDNPSQWAYSIMAARTIWGIGILNVAPGVRSVSTCAVCKMITLKLRFHLYVMRMTNATKKSKPYN